MNHRSITFVLPVMLVGSVSQGLVAAVIHVGPGGDYTQIQAAIDAAQNGDTVLVAPGLYVESISYRGKAITVASEAGAAVTTIQGLGSSTVLFTSREGAEAVLEGFTVTGGSGTSSGSTSLGGGILCDESSPSVRDCVVQGNSADAGGGLYLNLSQASLAGVTISSNSSNGFGGGIHSQSSQPTLRDCTLTHNESPWSGAGIYAQDSVITLIDTTISKHECPGHGSACDAHLSSINLTGCTIEDNVAGNEGTVRIVGGSLAATACSFRRNLAAQFSGGIFADVTELAVMGCTFENNTVDPGGASAGGALHLTAPSGTVSGNVMRNNAALIAGGLEYHGNLLIEGNEVTDNSGSGIVGRSLEGTTLRHNTVLDNSKTGISLTCRSLVLVEDNVIARNQLEGIHWWADGGATLFVTGNLLEANQTGISVTGGFSVTVARNRIVGSTAVGAVLGVNLQTTVEDNFVAFNKGGGIWKYGSSSAVIARNQILSNQGIGLDVSGQSALIINNYVYGNSYSGTRDGAGMVAFPGHGTMSIINNTVVANVGTGRGCGLYSSESHSPIVRNNIFWHNQGVSEVYPANLDVAHCDVELGYPGTGNIDADPRFVDEARGDLHLLATSPCLDAGVIEQQTPDGDAEGDPRVAPDMGADEFFPHLYFTGVPSRGEVIELKVLGPPGVGPVKVFVSAALLDVPLPTPWGDWYLVFPVVRLVLGTLSNQGLIEVAVEVPDWLPPMLIATQAFVPAQLTNPFPLQIQ